MVSGLNVDLVDQDQDPDLVDECHNNQGKIIDVLSHLETLHFSLNDEL